MSKEFYRLLVLILFTSFLYHAAGRDRTYIVPTDKKKKKEVTEEIKKEVVKPDSYLNEIFRLLKEASEQTDSKIILDNLKKAQSLLRKEYKDKKGKIPGLDCIKKAIYNVKNDKISLAVTKNIPKSILELYADLDTDQIKKLKYFLSKK